MPFITNIVRREIIMERIIEIIKSINPLASVNESTRLLEEHTLDSLSMITLVSELEDEFDVEISARDIVPENFETVGAIAELIERLEDED